MLKVCLDNGVVEDVADVSERAPLNVIVGAFGVAGDKAIGIAFTLESLLSLLVCRPCIMP